LSETIKSNKVIIPATIISERNEYEIEYPKDIFIVNNNLGFKFLFTNNNGIVKNYKLGIDTVDGYLPSIAFKVYQVLSNNHDSNVNNIKFNWQTFKELKSKNKVIFIGATSRALLDSRISPSGDSVSNTEIQALAFITICNKLR